MNMINSATGWIDIQEARTDFIANQVELAWLTGYHVPNNATVDIGKVLLVECIMMMANDYRIPCSPIDVR